MSRDAMQLCVGQMITFYVVGLLIAAVYAVWAYPDSFLDDISNYATWILVFWSNAVLLVIMRDTK